MIGELLGNVVLFFFFSVYMKILLSFVVIGFIFGLRLLGKIFLRLVSFLLIKFWVKKIFVFFLKIIVICERLYFDIECV